MEHQYPASKKVSRKAKPEKKTREALPSTPNDNVLQLQRIIGNQATTKIFRQEANTAPELPGTFDWLSPRESQPAEAVGPQAPLLTYNMMSFEALIAAKSHVLSEYDAAEDKASYEQAEKELQAINTALEEKAASIFSRFNPEIAPTLEDIALSQESATTQQQKKDKQAAQQRINFGLPAQAADRVKFIDVMSLYLGSSEKVAAHFGSVRKANVPGVVYLHDSAAKQIEAVQNDIGKEKMPTSYVALGIRGRYHTRESKSRMAHPLGYAVDYYPADTPMVTDRKALKLLEVVTGQSSHLNFTDKKGKSIGYNERRSMIKAMGAGTDKSTPAMSEAVEHFMGQVDGEIKRVADASMKFRKSLGQANTDQLRQLRVEYLTLKSDQARLSSMTSKASVTKLLKKVTLTNKGKVDPVALKKLTEETEASLGQAEAKFEDVLAPWMQMIETRRAELDEMIQKIDERLKEIEDRLKLVGERVAEIDARVKILDKEIKDKATPAETKTALRAERAEIQKERASLVAEKTSLTKEKTGLDKQRKTPDTERQALQGFATQIQEIEQMQDTLAQNKSRMADLSDEMQKLMSPWFKLINADLKAQEEILKPLDTRLEELDARLKAIKERLVAIEARTKAIAAALKVKGTSAEVKTALATEQKEIQKEQALLVAEQKTLTGEQKTLQKQRSAPGSEHQTLTQLSEALKDPEYVLGATTDGATLDSGVKDVSIMQLVNRGFFTIEGDEYDPDVQMKDGSIRENPKRSPDDSRAGFNSTFMKTMMRHGFDLGIAWDTLDAMHFELVTGVESVADKDDTAQGFSDVAQRYSERKKKVFKEPQPTPTPTP